MEPIKNLIDYFAENEGYYNFLNSNNLENDLNKIFGSKRESASEIKKFSKPDINNKYSEGKLKGIQKGKRGLDKKVALENKDGFWYKPVKLFSNIVYGDLESLLESQKERLDNFNLETENSLEKLGEYNASLNKGFDNLCYDWMKADSFNRRYDVKIDNLEKEKKDISLFSLNFLRNFKEKEGIANEIKLYKEKIKDLDLKKKDIQKSFPTYGILSEKNEKDILFLGHLKSEKDYYSKILDSTGGVISNFDNDQDTYSLDSLKLLKEFNEKVHKKSFKK